MAEDDCITWAGVSAKCQANGEFLCSRNDRCMRSLLDTRHCQHQRQPCEHAEQPKVESQIRQRIVYHALHGFYVEHCLVRFTPAE